MSIEHRAVSEILRHVRAVADSRSGAAASALVEKITHRLNMSRDLECSVRTLYTIAGFGDFSLRLLWLMRHVAQDGKLPDDSIMKSEAQCLFGLLPDIRNAPSLLKAPSLT
jgi:hypothetical protein